MKTVFTNGIFDLFHAGHLDLLTRARGMGDRLVVAVNDDASTSALKAGRPIVPEAERLAVVAALRCVDLAFLTDFPVEAIRRKLCAGDVYVKADEPGVRLSLEVHEARKAGANVVLIGKGPAISTTTRLAQIRGSQPANAGACEDLAKFIVACHQSGGTIYVGGNGGSAAEAGHFVAELLGRFSVEREPVRAVNLAADMATVTAIANDYGADDIFARQLAVARARDVVVLLSTSGRSMNILRAANVARQRGATVLAMTRSGSPLAGLAHRLIAVDGDTAAVQEQHLACIHAICRAVDGLLGEAL